MTTFTQGTLPKTSNWSGVAFGGGLYIAATMTSSVGAISSDGVTWTDHWMPGTTQWSGIAYGNGVFVLANYAGAAYSATGGDSWTSVTTPFPNTSWRSGVTFTGGKFFLTRSGVNIISYSTNGSSWTGKVLPAAIVSGVIVFGGGLFLSPGSGGSMAVSDDGITWASSVILPTTWVTPSAGTYGGGRFLFLSSGTDAYVYSDDGVIWTAATLPTSGAWYSIKFGNGAFIAMAYEGHIIASADGVVWETLSPPIMMPVFGQTSLVSDGSNFVAVGYGTNKSLIFAYEPPPPPPVFWMGFLSAKEVP